MNEIQLLRNQFVKLQELVTSLKNKDSFVIKFVTNETIAQSLNRNIVYVNNDTEQFIIYDNYNNEWKYYDIGGLSFDDLSSILIAGTNTTIVVDSIAQTITINSTGGGTSTTYIRRSDYVILDRKSYIGIAVSGSLETDAVWTIWVTITNSSGVVLSNTQYLNKKWSERGLL